MISPCGFGFAEYNYEAVEEHFDISFDRNYTKIICSLGELLGLEDAGLLTELS
ncbi:hypothetical protein [Ruminiclostridium papyrosolvens]|uniref:Uncharacterized protein n=1 Tax=Ruminiclostridium papyrosolvens C7 TaxID=1330534 RepID=U4R6T9_9FIRM|nr:hypothetical protein [Ruminiclostridium papyrosolvens]EPR14581.1 hypothetical protein L323_00040 [Ruminiclostridium papyrosolvens C7]